MSRKLTDIDESGVDRSYYHGTISREEAVGRLQKANTDGAFLLRMSASEEGAYTISLQSNGEIKHIRVRSTDEGFSLGKSKDKFPTIWDLVEAQLDKSLKSTKGDQAVQLVYPLPTNNEAIAPDVLEHAADAGMDPTMFDDDVMKFMTGGVSAEEVVARRKKQLDEGGFESLVKP